MNRIRLDVASEELIHDWLDLEAGEANAVWRTLRKIRQLTWNQLYVDKGIRWEQIHSRTARDGEAIYSLRLTRRMRALALRRGESLVFLSLHPDHDSAYP
jgi:hypothetical protein